MNFASILVASLIPLAIGFIWCHPKVLGDLWMRETYFNNQKI